MAPRKTAVPFRGQTTVNFEAICPPNGTAVLQELTHIHAPTITRYFRTVWDRWRVMNAIVFPALAFTRRGINPVINRTAVPSWGQSIQIINSVSLKRDCSAKAPTPNNFNPFSNAVQYRGQTALNLSGLSPRCFRRRIWSREGERETERDREMEREREREREERESLPKIQRWALFIELKTPAVGWRNLLRPDASLQAVVSLWQHPLFTAVDKPSSAEERSPPPLCNLSTTNMF